ncbi:MAG: co-chaperone GroES [Legionellales bacterium]|nr:co-chaperone GroES [Legionellales bacterium]
MSNIRPLHDRVVVQRLENETKTTGGILIPDTAGEKPIMGIIVAVGPGKTSESGVVIEVAVKKGDKVLFGKYAGTEVEVAGKKLVVMREDDIMGIIEG